MTDQILASLRRPRLDALPFAALAALLAVAALLALGLGALAITPVEILSILAERLELGPLVETGAAHKAVLLSVRLPRVVLAIAVGAGLAASGAALQGLFRNPLADPALLGVSSGAALAAATAILLGGSVALSLPAILAPWFLPVSAFLGAAGVTAIVYGLAIRREAMDLGTLLLAGIAINALAGAGLGLATFFSEERQLRDITFWLLGSLAGSGWPQLLPVLVMIAAALALLLRLARPLNALLLGEAEAFHVGFAVEPVKRQLVMITALASGAAVALTGTIGFVGLLVPHLARFLVGPDHRRLLPAAAMLGAALLLLTDLIGRLVVLPAELPIGVVTSFLGAPFFLWLLRRKGRV
jgi:iron complex transport system permease protein